MLSVREIKKKDIGFILDYWYNASPDHLESMGASIKKLPSRQKMFEMLVTDIALPLERKSSYVMMWFMNRREVGHSNVNKITYGKEAYMHFHLWHPEERQKGMGTELVRMSLPYYFENLKLETLFCEPYALNPAPNRVLENVGFQFEKEYTTTPGYINFEQQVRRWKLTRERYRKLILQP
ncbi:GNAT family N-acetyltransferase [Fulvivirga sp. 29W222]|uniref:GNAT family N-acetyltransferase n=1 Tax=Fulvivirga marina TaxID=2494733 RepID=A0A937FWM3_9BACT|nr:GNAT family protein [Fulvivirga marina]MBL6446022.1 GNAT family N-acetyltransferase [Fulvivirga marina]